MKFDIQFKNQENLVQGEGSANIEKLERPKERQLIKFKRILFTIAEVCLEKSTVVGHWKVSGIGDNVACVEWVNWWVGWWVIWFVNVFV